MTEISAQSVKELREKTGAGFMECKKALSEARGDVETALENLRKQGLAQAQKKAARTTSQGWIGHYVHSNGRIGVLLELFCETDFVAKNPTFQELLKDLCMQIAAANPLVVRPEELPPGTVAREREIFIAQAKEKPEAARDKIVQGKLEKYYADVCLLRQSFIKDDKKTVQDHITEKIATLGENIAVGRFLRLDLGAK